MSGIEKQPRVTGRKRREIKKMILTVLVIVLVVDFVIGIFVCRDVWDWGKPDKEYLVEIPAGAGSSIVAEILHEQDIIAFPRVFKVYARLIKATGCQKGRHIINSGMSYKEMLQKLGSAPDAGDIGTRKVVIPEGYELWQIIDLLVESGLGDKDIFYQEVESGVFDHPFVAEIPQRPNRLEGYLYPDTYLFSPDETEHEILSRMLDAFSQKVLPVYENSGTGKSLDEVIVMASVVEREAANDEERPNVASVFYNRLKIGMKLESCATVQYILKERKEILSNQDTLIDSPYNTYRYEGLPLGPIASPGLSSVEASLRPAVTNYLYFVAKADGSGNQFSETFEAHNQKTIETQN